MKIFVWTILAATCLPFFLVGLFEANRNARELSGFARANGVVVANFYDTTLVDNVISGAYFPVVEFLTADGEKIRFTDGIGSLPPDYAVSATIAVIYDPQEPSRAKIYSWKRVWLAPAILLSVGLLPLVVFEIVRRNIARWLPTVY